MRSLLLSTILMCSLVSSTIFAQEDVCPDIKAYDLRGITAFAQADEFVICGALDTLAFLFFSNDTIDIKNLTIELNLSDGLQYAGFVEAFYDDQNISELNTSDLENPKFLISELIAGEAFIAHFGVSANCDIDISNEVAFVDLEFSYVYVNDSTQEKQECLISYEPMAEFSAEFKFPILNILSVLDDTDSDAEVNLSTTNTPECHSILISQDGIGAYLQDFLFSVDGLNTNDLNIEGMTVNGIPFTDYTYDPITMRLEALIGSTYFSSNFDPNGLPVDTLFDENEQLTIELCYSVEGCLDNAVQFLEFGATYGCMDDLCVEPNTMEGSVLYAPDFGADPSAVLTQFDQVGMFCGDDFIWSTTIFSVNDDPLEGLWEDVSLKWKSCDGGNTQVTDVQIGGVSVPFISQSGSIIVDFANNNTPLIGLSDANNDGFFNDIIGGDSISLTVVMDVVCSEANAISCASSACSIEIIELNFKRNCGLDEQDFADLNPPIAFSYGETDFMTNETVLLEGIYVTENHFSGDCSTWKPFDNGYNLQYTFGFENLTGCGGSNIYAEIVITGGLTNMNNPPPNSPVGFENVGTEWKDLRYMDGSATYMDNPVAGTSWSYELEPISGDTIGIRILIPAGDVANDSTGHDYYFNLESNGHCSTPDYIFASWQVKEECDGCVEGDCTVLRSCHSVKTYIEWNSDECVCPCPWAVRIDTMYRCNYGYTDKTMTEKVDPANIPSVDLNRFLPGDSMYVRVEIEIYDIELFREGNAYWYMYFHEQGFTAPGMLDAANSQFIDMYHKDADTDVQTPLRFDCISQYYPGNGEEPLIPEDENSDLRVSIQNFGVEGAYIDNDAPQECIDKMIDNASPNWPLDQQTYAGRRIADGQDIGYGSYESLNGNAYRHGNSSNDQHDDTHTIYVHFGQLPECGGVSDANTCFQSILDEYDFQAGDKIQWDLKVPVVASPFADSPVDFNENNILAPWFNAYTWDPNSCTTVGLGRACREYTPWEFHKPGPINHVTTVDVTDCEISVEHSFTLENPVPEVPDTIIPWYENEYRPAMGVEYLDIEFPSNLIYQGDMVIEDYFGMQTPIDGKWFDEGYGNLACIEDSINGTCCSALYDSIPTLLRINDQAYFDGQNSCYVYLTYNEPLINQPLDPFPLMSVGGTNDCNFKIKYDLLPLCPEELSSSDFKLSGQFAQIYVKDHISYSGQANRILDPNYPISEVGTPYGVTVNEPAYVHNHNDYSLIREWYVPFGPDPVIYPNHPDRHQTNEVTTPDNFMDNSLNYPPLVPDISQTLIADLIDENEIVRYTVCAGNTAGATHENVSTSISLPVLVELVEVLDSMGNSIPVTFIGNSGLFAIYQIDMPNLAPDDCTEIDIVTELLFCPVGTDFDTEICMQTVSGCIDATKAATLSLGSGSCSETAICYKYIKEEAGLQVEWINPSESVYPLCDTIDFEIRIKNVRAADLVNLAPEIFIPLGIEVISGSWESAYPGGPNNIGIWDSIADPNLLGVTPHGLAYDFDSANDFEPNYVGPNGLLGIAGNSAITDSNKVSIRFRGITRCDAFTSGSKAKTLVSASDPCETTIATPLIESLPIIINGANPDDFAQFITFVDPGELQCGSSTEVTFTGLNVSPVESTTLQTNMCLTFPPADIQYILGSVNFTTPTGFVPEVTETISSDTIMVCIQIPDGIGKDEIFSFNAEMELAENAACGTSQIGVEIASTIEGRLCVESGDTCTVDVLNSINPLVDISFNPPLIVPELTVTSTCDGDEFNTVVEYTFNIENPDDITYDDNISVIAVRDINENGVIEDFDMVLDSAGHAITLMPGESLEIIGNMTMTEEFACPVLFAIRQNTDCVCDEIVFPITEIAPKFIVDLGDQQTLCPDDDLSLIVCGNYEYNLSPAEGGSIILNQSTNEMIIEINEGYGEDTPVELSVQGVIGACETVAKLDIYKVAEFSIGPYEPVGICVNECMILELGLSEEIAELATIQWSPSIFLDDSTSANPEVCNPTIDVVYTATVTLNTGTAGCLAMAQYSIISNPLPIAFGAEIIACELADGTADFDLSSADLEVDPTGSNEVSYHITEIEAQNNANALPSLYNATDSTSLFVRVENVEACGVVEQIVLFIAPNPEAEDLTLEACDLDDGTAIFDLVTATMTIDSTGSFSVTYHDLEPDANAGDNPINTSDSYNSGDNQLFIRIQSDQGCYSLNVLTLEVIDCCDSINCLEVELLIKEE